MHNIAKEDKDYYLFRGDNNKKEDVPKYKEIWETISKMKGKRNFRKSRRPGLLLKKQNQKKE